MSYYLIVVQEDINIKIINFRKIIFVTRSEKLEYLSKYLLKTYGSIK